MSDEMEKHDQLKERVAALENEVVRLKEWIDKTAVDSLIPIKTNVLIGAYCEAFKSRYGVSPIITGKMQGRAKDLAKNMSVKRARDLIQAYVQMDDPWFKTKCHDLDTFFGNLSKVSVALANGTNNPHEKDFWREVFNERKGVSGANDADAKDVGGKKLHGGTSRGLLARPERDPG